MPSHFDRRPSDPAAARALVQAELFAWLDQEPDADLAHEIRALQLHIASLSIAADWSPSAALLAALVERLSDAAERLKARLSLASLPLDGGLHRAVRELTAAYLDAAQLVGRILGSLQAGGLVFQGGLLAAIGGTALPAEVWAQAYALGEGLRESSELAALLALSCTQPESLTPRELLWLEAYLTERPARLSWQLEAGVSADEAGYYWFVPSDDPARARAPVSLRRQLPPPDAWCFSTAALGQRAADDLAALQALHDERDLPDWLPAGLTMDEAAALLERLRCYWLLPPRRTDGREQGGEFPVRMCVGLRALCAQLAGGRAELSSWQVLNRSAQGLALASDELPQVRLLPGSVLGLQAPAGHWQVYVLRWLHSPAPGQAEIGVQWLADAAWPLTVFQPDSETPGERIPALQLAIDGAPALLTPPGCAQARRLEVQAPGQSDYRLQVLQPGPVLLRTAGAELFRFSQP